MPEVLQTLDMWLLNRFREAVCAPELDGIMTFITRLGDGGIIWIIAGTLLLFFPRYCIDALKLLLGIGVGFIVGNLILKNLVARPRPCWLDETVGLLIPKPADYSFPSGHTLSSAIAAFTLTKANRKFGAVTIPLFSLIALSRLYLFVHFPSDILAAAALGAAISMTVPRVVDGAFCRLQRARA